MVVLIDANIVLDYLLRREPFYSDISLFLNDSDEQSDKG